MHLLTTAPIQHLVFDKLSFNLGIKDFLEVVGNDFDSDFDFISFFISTFLNFSISYIVFFPAHKLFAKKQWEGLGAKRIF